MITMLTTTFHNQILMRIIQTLMITMFNKASNKGSIKKWVNNKDSFSTTIINKLIKGTIESK